VPTTIPDPAPETWALHFDTSPMFAVVLVIQTSPGQPPAVHGLAPTRSGAAPGRALAALGWQTVSGWLDRSWGSVAAVQPVQP
jgi:hypothetical protein